MVVLTGVAQFILEIASSTTAKPWPCFRRTIVVAAFEPDPVKWPSLRWRFAESGELVPLPRVRKQRLGMAASYTVGGRGFGPATEKTPGGASCGFPRTAPSAQKFESGFLQRGVCKTRPK